MLFVLLLFSVLINNGFFHIINSASKILDMLQMAVFVIAFMVILRMRNNNGKIVHDTKVSFLYSIYIVFFVGFQFFYCCIINQLFLLTIASQNIKQINQMSLKSELIDTQIPKESVVICLIHQHCNYCSTSTPRNKTITFRQK